MKIYIYSRPLLLCYSGESDQDFQIPSSFISERKAKASWMIIFFNYLASKNSMENIAKKRNARKF